MSKSSRFVVCVFGGLVVSLLLALSPNWSSPAGAEVPPFVQVQPSADAAIAQAAEGLEVSPAQERFVPQNFPARDLDSPSEDPADQIAPPGLPIRPGSDPISPFLAIRMQQELDNLVGRFESALFLANAVDQPAEVRIVNTEEDPVSSAVGKSTATDTPSAGLPVLVEARQLSQDWAGLMDSQSYGEARDRWLTIRQELWDNFPLDRSFAQPEIRAMWLDRGSIVRARSRQGLATLFDNMQTAGINTVFFETINAGYPVYRTQVAPVQNPLTEGWDPLKEAVELAHERNMDLHAWMWVFAAGNQRHNVLVNKSEAYLGPLLGANPSWVAYDNAGSPIPLGQTKPFYDPANPEVREFLLQLVDEIISNYDVDGLQLDYIRYPFQDPSDDRTYGYGVAARQQFLRQTGVDPLELTPLVDPWLPRAERERLRSLWEQWEAFRIEQVTSFVADTSELVRSKRPDIVLSAAVFAMSEHERLQKIQQDWNAWARDGLVDWIVLMSYAQDTSRFHELVDPWLLEQDYGSTLVIPGIRLLGMPVPVMIDQLQALRDLPSTGYALFATDNLDNRIQTVLNSTQGAHTAWVPHKNSYATAAARFEALQKEWNWLIANEQMVLQPRLADRWIEQVNGLGQALKDLAKNPSATPEAVRAQLRDVKQSIGVGIRLQTATTPDYRLRAWKYRLESIDRFLMYGDRRKT